MGERRPPCPNLGQYQATAGDWHVPPSRRGSARHAGRKTIGHAMRWTVDSGACFELADSSTARNAGRSVKQVASHRLTVAHCLIEVSEEASALVGELGLNADILS